MDTKIIGISIAAVIGIIVLGSVLMPILDNATATTDTFTNEGYFHMQKYDTSTDVTISWDHANPKVITVNDVDYSMSGVLPYNQWTSMIVADDWYFRYADGLQTQFVQVTYGGITNIPGASNSTTDFEIVCSDGTATINAIGTGGTQTKTATYTNLYIVSDNDAPFVMKKSDVSAYMGKDTPFVALGSSAVGTSQSAICRIDGTIAGGATVDVIASTNDDTTLVADSVVINTTELSDNVGYQLSTIQFQLTNTSGDTDVTYSYYVVPAEVTIEKSEHLSDGQNQLLAVIPMLVIVAILLGVVALVVRSRME